MRRRRKRKRANAFHVRLDMAEAHFDDVGAIATSNELKGILAECRREAVEKGQLELWEAAHKLSNALITAKAYSDRFRHEMNAVKIAERKKAKE